MLDDSRTTLPRLALPPVALAIALGSCTCGDDGVVPDDETSTGEVTESSGESASADDDVSPTASADSSGESPPGEESSSSDTGPTPAAADIRIIYEDDADETIQRFLDIELVDGVLGEPVTVFEDVGDDHTLTTMGERWLALQRQAELRVVDSRPPHPDFVLEVPDDTILTSLDTTTADGSLWLVRAIEDPSTTLFAFPFGDAGPMPPYEIAADLPADLAISRASFVLGDTAVVLEVRDTIADARSVWLAPADGGPVVPGPLAEAVDGALHDVSVDPSGTLVAYSLGGIPVDALAYEIVDLSTDPIGAPLGVGMLEGAVGLSHLRFAPDPAGLAITQQGEGDIEDIAWIPIADGVPGEPVQLSAGELAGTVIGRAEIAPDGRWAVFPAGDPEALWAARIADGAPGAAVPLAGAGVRASYLEFGTDAAFAYFLAFVDEQAAVLQRVALDGDEPGEPQSCSSMITGYYQHFVVADDGRSLFYVAAHDDASGIHAYRVDLSGDTPGEPERIDGDASGGIDLFSIQVAPAGTHAIYRVAAVDADDPKVLVDIASGSEFALNDGAPVGLSWMLPASADR